MLVQHQRKDGNPVNMMISGNGHSEIGKAISKAFSEQEGATVFQAGYLDHWDFPPIDVAICVTGSIIVGEAAHMEFFDLRDTWESNYLHARTFIEELIERGCKLIIILGSVASRYGNVYAEDYAAAKAALAKYVELRARTAREQGVRLMLLNLGAVATQFWQGVDDKYASIKPDMQKALTADEVAQTVVMIAALPERVCLREALVVATAYQ